MKAKWAEDKLQRAEAQKEYDFLKNLQKPYMIEHYSYLYETSEKGQMAIKINKVFNLTEQLIKELAVTFEQGITVEVKIANQEVKSDDVLAKEKEFNELLNNINLLPTLKEMDKLAELNKYCAISVVWDDEAKTVRLDLIPRYLCFVKQADNNPKAIREFNYSIGVSENSPGIPDNITLYQRLTSDTISTVEIGSGGSVKKEYDIINNPYGQIPVVDFIPEIRVDTYFPQSKSPIVDFNIEINEDSTDFRHTFSMQCFSILFVDGKVEGGLKIGQSTYLNLAPFNIGDNVDAKYLNPGTDLDKLLGVVQKKCERFANAVGVSASLYNNTQSEYSSGYHLMLAKSDIIKKANDRAGFYQQSLNRLVNLIAKVWSYNNEKTYENYEITAKINKLKVEMSETEKNDNDLKKLNLEQISKVEILMRDRQLSEEEAVIELAKIREQNKIQTITPNIDIVDI